MPLLPGRDPKAGTDQGLDTMFERALSVREFARLHGWPLPQPEHFKWRRCVLVILGAILATLLLGQVLERLRQTPREPIAPPAPTATQLATQTVPQPRQAPRAQLVRLPPWRVGEARMVKMPDGRLVLATYRGGLPSVDMLLNRRAQPGDAYWIDNNQSLWILTAPLGSTRLSWIDP
jgi:hypothetical protein